MRCGADSSIQHADRLAVHIPRSFMDSHEENLAAAQKYAASDSIRTSAVMVIQGGEVVDQWGGIGKKIDSYSVRKSLLSDGSLTVPSSGLPLGGSRGGLAELPPSDQPPAVNWRQQEKKDFAR